MLFQKELGETHGEKHLALFEKCAHVFIVLAVRVTHPERPDRPLTFYSGPMRLCGRNLGGAHLDGSGSMLVRQNEGGRPTHSFIVGIMKKRRFWTMLDR